LTGRFDGEPSTTRVNGKAGSEKIGFNIFTKSKHAGHEDIPSVLIRMKIADLADRFLWSDVGNLPGQIKCLAPRRG
jgi:hypothetical protein